MPKQHSKVVFDAASQMTKGDRIRVTYYSHRAEEDRSMEGEVRQVKVRKGELVIVLFRDDGQKLMITGDGGFYSIGSHVPFNGPVMEIEII